MIVIECTAAIDAAGTLQKFYISTDAFVTGPADTPPNTAFDTRLVDPGSLGVSAYSDASTTSGASQLQVGEMVLANTDGALDSWLNYSFDGRPVTIRSGEATSAYPAGFTLIFQGTMENADADWKNLIIKLRDRQYIFDMPALTNTYLGNNALPAGVEGTPADLKGQVKPKVLGSVFQISPKLVNTSKLTYQVNDGAVAAISAVYDRGTPLTLGANFATSALLQASTPAAGTFNTCLAQGYFQLGASPAGTITADVLQGAAPANRTIAQILYALGTLAGLGPSDFSAGDMTALDTANSSVVGIWLDGSTTFLEAMDQIAASAGVWFGFDSPGLFRMGQLTAPSGTPVLSLHDYDFADTITRRSARDNNIPVWKVVVSHTKVWTVQTDLAGAVPAATRAYLALDYRTALQQDTSIQTQYKLATVLDISGLLTDATAASNEAARQLALQKVRRDVFDVTISTSLLPATPLMFMDIVQLTVSRFGLDSGKLFRLIGIDYKLATNQVGLTLWG